jgi:ribosomal protein L32
MTKRTNYVGPCATACKPGAGTDAQDGTFDRIIVAAAEHAAREVGLPGRADRMIACRSCGAETTADRICPDCAEALRVERAAALDELCRVHRVRYVEDLPVSVLEEMQAEWGRR